MKNDIVTRDNDAVVTSKIILLRGVQVILDRDIAALYGVATKVLNQAVKRNLDRFPSDFMFQLTREECSRSQSVTLNSGRGANIKYLPYAFTENGVAMLSGVLRTPKAIEINIRIVRAFIAMRRFVIANSAILQRLDAVEVKQIAMDEKLNDVLGKIESKEFPSEKIFYDGHEYDAYEKTVEFIRKAKKEIIIIDAYADNVALQILAKKRDGVTATIVKGPRARLSELDVTKFNAQFAHALTVKTSTAFHDRFIILDQSVLLHVGASLNYLGKKCFAFSAMDASNIPSLVAKIT